MIVDSLENAHRYESLHAGFRSAFRFLARGNLADLPLGRHEIDGDRVFAIIERGTQPGRAAVRLEAHREYIDVRYIIGGTDEVGWRATQACRTVAAPYDEATDMMFYADAAALWIPLPTGTLSIYFPQDAHAPMAGHGEVHRVVVKVAVNHH